MVGCGLLPGSGGAATPTSGAPTPAPNAAAGVPSPSPVGSPSPVASRPTSTPQASASNTVYVGNTDGDGVFVRKTPNMDDKVSAYPDGTALTIIGDDVDGDGQHWKHVRTPDGLEGYVPSMYTTDAPQ